MTFMTLRFLLSLLLPLLALGMDDIPLPPSPAPAPALGVRDRGVRLKDLVSIEGVRSNQLIGYGLVVGLNGTGDRQQTQFSVQSLTNLLQRMGVTTPPAAITVKNTAAVLVTATLPPFAQPGAMLGRHGWQLSAMPLTSRADCSS